jgi:hypothetical protein
MGLLFLIALFLAWPTYGLSLLAWLGYAFLKARADAQKSLKRQERMPLWELLFPNGYARFFDELDVPAFNDYELQRHDREKCGRHIVNYLAQNDSEGLLFLQGLSRWRQADGVYADPIAAIAAERSLKGKGNVHLVAFRAIEAIMMNNPKLACFNMVDLTEVSHRVRMMELAQVSAA